MVEMEVTYLGKEGMQHVYTWPVVVQYGWDFIAAFIGNNTDVLTAFALSSRESMYIAKVNNLDVNVEEVRLRIKHHFIGGMYARLSSA